MDLYMELSRRRDFISLILSYPMRIGDESKLRRWMNGFFEWRAMDCTRASGSYRNRDHDAWPQYVELLVPRSILVEMTSGRGSIFGISRSRPGITPACYGRSKEKQARGGSPTTEPDLAIQEAIFDSATDLAVRQLIQTLISEDDYVQHIHHVGFSTRNNVEKLAAMGKIEAALGDRENELKITQEFLGVLRIDLSRCENDAEAQVQVLQQIAQHVKLTMTTADDNITMIKSCVEEEMMSRKYLVLVDGDWKLDLLNVCFQKTKFAGVVVLITTEDSGQETEELKLALDLEIRTEDHVLSWELFLWNVQSGSGFCSIVPEHIAVQIVKECRGHLLAITLVASSLKYAEDITLWESSLVKLRCSNSSYDTSIFDGMSRVMINAFMNIIWENINEREKYCLARCLSIPNVTEAMTYDEILISHWNATRPLYTEEEVRHIRKKFVESSVFLQGQKQLRRKPSKETYLLPKEIYDLLGLLNRLKPIVINQTNLWSDDSPEIGPVRKQWDETLEVELMDSGLSKLPQSPHCPQLRILFLQGNIDLIEIPPLFFNCMPLLLVLNLSYTSIRDLPNSFSNLVELRELYLRGCPLLLELPPGIGKLQKLEKLDLDGTQIIHLPQEMQELTHLQSLILSFCGYPTRNVGRWEKKCLGDSKSTIFPAGVISSLSRLVHLSIDVSPDDERWNDKAPVILEEISGLLRLETLGLYVPEVKLLKFILRCKPHLFKLVVGRHMQRIISRIPRAVEAGFEKSDKSLKFINGVDIPNEIDMILGHTEAFFLYRHKTIKHLSQFNLEDGNLLQVCILAECNQMQTIFDGEYMTKFAVNELRSLSVFCMKNLRDIWVGPSPPYTSFVLLRSLTLHNCPNLITIIPATLLGNLLNLEELLVEKCPKVITLVSLRSAKLTLGIYLTKLRKVSLLHLPELNSISNGFHIGLSLENIGFYDCPKLQSLSKSELSSSNLRVIKGEINWWEALKWSEAEWGQPGRPDHIRNIFCPINEEADVMSQLIGDGM